MTRRSRMSLDGPLGRLATIVSDTVKETTWDEWINRNASESEGRCLYARL